MASLLDLTTVRQPVHQQGEIAARMLLAILRDEPGLDLSVTVPTKLVVRGSTAKPRNTT